MNCPCCNTQLLMSERQRVEIDYCPNCRGIWLDRGELEKIIERENTSGFQKNHFTSHDDEYHGNKYENNTYGHPKKKGGFLGDLFDF